MTAVAAPAAPDDGSVEEIVCACGGVAALMSLDEDGVVTAFVRCACCAGATD